MTKSLESLMADMKAAADKYRATLAAHQQNPRNYDALDAWDRATSEFMELVNNDELNIIAGLFDKMSLETGYREGAFIACNSWHDKFLESEAKLEAAERRIAELEALCVKPTDAMREVAPLCVKLPAPLMPARHVSGELFMTPDNVEHGGYLNRDDVLRAIRAAGGTIEGSD